MPRHRLALLALLLALPACGAEAPRPPPAEPQPPALAPAGDAAGLSAFRLAGEAEQVRHTLDLAHFRKGVRRPDPRDAIPALLAPRFVALADATFLRPADRVIVVRAGEHVRAYPVYLLDRHELVNDVLGERPVLVTWCPLCGSSVVYDRRVDERTLTFGVSGYLYKSDVLMYDHATESFWSQLQYEAVAGPMTGTRLTLLPSTVTSVAALRAAHPDARVLGDDQGIVAPEAYRRPVYQGYDTSPRIWFPVGARSGALPPKAEVVGVVVDGRARAYALDGLRALRAPWEDTLGARRLTFTYAREGDEVRVADAEGRPQAAVRLYWFAWFAFHPDTDLWRARGQPLVTDPGAVPVAAPAAGG